MPYVMDVAAAQQSPFKYICSLSRSFLKPCYPAISMIKVFFPLTLLLYKQDTSCWIVIAY